MIVFGQQMMCHGKDYQLLRNLNMLTEGKVELKTEDRFQLIRYDILKRMNDAYNKNARAYNLRGRARSFEIGDEVVRRNFGLSNAESYFNAKLELERK